jgi:CheY-like chemotaxis protein
MNETHTAAVMPPQQVVVINGDAAVMSTLEASLDPGRYEMVFVDSYAYAYASVRRMLPDLIILCTSLDEASGFQLLTMLKLDPLTRDIPVLTYTDDGDDVRPQDHTTQVADDVPPLPARQAPRMN